MTPRTRFIGPILLTLALLFTGCSRNPPPPTAGSSSTGSAAESTGQRLVVLSPALGVMVQDLGFEDLVVGKHAWDMVLGSSIPAVGSHDDPDLERIVLADPTHILIERSATGVPPSMSRMAEEQGWTIWTLPLNNLDDIANSLDDLSLRLEPIEQEDESPLPTINPQDADPSTRFERVMPSARLADAWRDRGAPARGAGRVLMLAMVDPPGAMGPTSFHHQMIERMGATPALAEGGPWQELDHEDIARLNPDSILIFLPAPRDPNPIGEIRPPTLAESIEALGGIADLELNAIQSGRVAIVDHPLSLMPASSLGLVADEIGAVFDRWEGSGEATGP